ncbi:MAG TPA: aldolase/citrate lyase family protein [Thermoanaerobaculia bacterium]|nr:aldolase/citrate lyase family protein [Thermoanaerobaculia bacterium]
MVRSILCCPGHREEMIDRALVEGADMVLLDLEDGVPEDRKEEARRVVRRAIVRHAAPTPGPGLFLCQLAVRVNGVESLHFGADISMLRNVGFSGWLWLPKVEDPDDLRILDRALGFEGDQGRQDEALDVRVCALVESPAGLARVRELEVDALAFGRCDFLAAAGISERQDALVEHAQLQIALAARAAGIPCWDAPCYRGKDYLDVEIDFALRAGFTGKGCLSPAQIEPVNNAFSVPFAEINRAQMILRAARESLEAVAKLGEDDILSPPTRRWAEALLARVEVSA